MSGNKLLGTIVESRGACILSVNRAAKLHYRKVTPASESRVPSLLRGSLALRGHKRASLGFEQLSQVCRPCVCLDLIRFFHLKCFLS